MIKSETDSAWEVNKTTLAEDEMAEKMANLRAKKKPAKLSNISQDVLDLPMPIFKPIYTLYSPLGVS